MKPQGGDAFLMEEEKTQEKSFKGPNTNISLDSKKPGYFPRVEQRRFRTTNETISRILADSDVETEAKAKAKEAERKAKAMNIYSDLAHYNDVLAYCYSVDIQHLSYFVFWYIKETKLMNILAEISENPLDFTPGTMSMAHQLQTTAEEVITQPPQLMSEPWKLQKYWLTLYQKLDKVWKQTQAKEFRFYITFFIEIGLYLLPTEVDIRNSAHKLLTKMHGD